VTALLHIEHISAVFEDGCLPAVDLAGLETVLVAQVGDGDTVDEVPLNDGELLSTGESLALLGHGMESSGGKGRLTPHRQDSSFDGSKTAVAG